MRSPNPVDLASTFAVRAKRFWFWVLILRPALSNNWVKELFGERMCDVTARTVKCESVFDLVAGPVVFPHRSDRPTAA